MGVLEPAFTHLKCVASEVLATEFAPRSPLRTCILEVILHQDTWYLCSTFIGARNSIMFTRVKMSLSKQKPYFHKYKAHYT
jgi:hypothetical protein